MLEYGDFDSSDVIRSYLEWFVLKVWLICSRFNSVKNEWEHKFWLGMKRGDSFYCSRVRRRFDEVESRLPDARFFPFGFRGWVSSRCLALDLTYSDDISLFDAWSHRYKDVNRFLSALRSHYHSKLAVCKVEEAQLRGYPHFHLIILLKDVSFDALSRVTRRGHLRYCVSDKDEIASLWPHGFVDVFAMSSVKSGFHYGRKYLLKAVKVPKVVDADAMEKSELKHLLTLSYGWTFETRVFSLSGDWNLSPGIFPPT
jgi:hypothetical protein